MRRLLVTGGAGFIGSNFIHYWLAHHPGDFLLVLDALTYAGNRANLRAAEARAELRFVHGNICDTSLVERLLNAERIDTIVNFAAESHVDRSIHRPGTFIETNVVGTHSLLQAARQVWLQDHTVPEHRFHQVSTDEVYGSLAADDPAFSESTPFAPNSPYAASKAASDHLVRAYHHTYGLQVTTSNCSNNYGPWQFPEKLIPLFTLNILEGRELPLYGDGTDIRDWLFVEDHCRAIELILSEGVPGRVYNVGGRSEFRNVDVVKRLCALVDSRVERDRALAKRFPNCLAVRGETSEKLIRFVPLRPGHDHRYAIDCDRVTRELGFNPSVSLESGLARTLEWYLQNEPWWRHVMDGRYREWISTQYAISV